MITLNVEQRLGKKAYFLMVAKKMFLGLMLFLVTLLVFVLAGPLAGFIAGLTNIATGKDALTTANYIAEIILKIDVGLIILTLLIVLRGIVSARIVYKHYTFTFEEFDLKLKKGTLNIKEISIPYRQMQNVNIERGMWHQMTGTSRIIVESAGEDEPTKDDGDNDGESDIVLDPVDKELADEIRLMLQRKIGVQVVQTEKEADREAKLESISTSTPQ